MGSALHMPHHLLDTTLLLRNRLIRVIIRPTQASSIKELSCLRDGVFYFSDNSLQFSSSAISESIVFVSSI
jgi:hypothetical protein